MGLSLATPFVCRWTSEKGQREGTSNVTAKALSRPCLSVRWKTPVGRVDLFVWTGLHICLDGSMSIPNCACEWDKHSTLTHKVAYPLLPPPPLPQRSGHSGGVPSGPPRLPGQQHRHPG